MHDGNGAKDVPEVLVRKRRKGIYILPNLFTLAALFGGFMRLSVAVDGRFDYGCYRCVFCAMVLDSLDGRVACMTNTQSAFGEQMDSLSDMVSLARRLRSSLTSGRSRIWGAGGWIAAFVYCACAALRLARFNVNTGVVTSVTFRVAIALRRPRWWLV